MALTKRQKTRLDNCTRGSWLQNEDGSISTLAQDKDDANIDGSFICGFEELETIPIKLKDVAGDFWCCCCKLTTCDNWPDTIGGMIRWIGNPLMPTPELIAKLKSYGLHKIEQPSILFSELRGNLPKCYGLDENNPICDLLWQELKKGLI